MELDNIEKLLSDLMLSSNMSSLKVAGGELIIYFSGSNINEIYEFFIDTDAWVFVEDENTDIDYSIINDENFIPYRRKAIVRLYDLTGYDIESVEVVEKKYLRLIINGMAIVVCPTHRLIQNNLYQETWDVITKHNNGKIHLLMKFENDELIINEENPVFVT